MEENTRRIAFTNDENDEVVFFYVLEQTKINGVNYLLVVDREEGETDEEDEEAGVECEALILEEKTEGDSEEAVYEIVEDEGRLAAVSGVFEELLENLEINL